MATTDKGQLYSTHDKSSFMKRPFHCNKKQNFRECADFAERRNLQRKKITDTYDYNVFRGQGYQSHKHTDFKQQSIDKRGPVENETYEYFDRVSEKLKIGFNSDEAKAMFIANVVEQTEDKEVELSCNRMISHTLQMLLETCEDSIIIMKFAKAFSSSLRQICTNQYGSHVIESLLSSGMKILKKSSDYNSDCQHGEKESSDSSLNIISWILKFGKFCLNNVEHFLGHIYASHVLRALIEVWSGVTLEESVKKSKRSINQKRKFQKSEENSTLIQSSEVAKFSEIEVPEEFVSQLKEFYRKIIELNNLIDCCIDTKISPILQTLLIGLQKRSPRHCQKFIKLLMRSVMAQKDEMEMPIALTDKSSSCVIEKAILTADEKRQVWLWKHCFKNIVKSLVLHPVANFIVQRLFTALKRKEQFEEMFNEVCPYFEEIFVAGHNGVIISIAEACVRLSSCQPVFMQVMMKTLHCYEPEQRQLYLSALVIQLSTYTSFEKKEKLSVNSVLLKDISLSYHGSLLLQHMLQFHKPVKVVKSILFMKDDLRSIACDGKGTYVLESFLTAAHVGEKNREKLLVVLKPHLVSLACHKFGSRVLDSIWTAASLKQRILISQELSSNESQLVDNMYGRYVSKKCGLFYFKRRNNDWKQVQNTETKKRKIFSDIVS